MVLEHVEEDEDAVTKGKADEKQKKAACEDRWRGLLARITGKDCWRTAGED